MRKRTPKPAGEDPIPKIVGGVIGVIVGILILWYFFSYGIAALFG